MKTALLTALAVTLFTSLLLVSAEPLVQEPDPPLPDAVAFCHLPTEGGSDYENCTCAHEDYGHKCNEPKGENGRPRWCKHMCGHAKRCGCCPT